ncbi:MAG: hypothetical protein AAGA64_15360 [Bacteroidota bacterium]
MSSKSKNRFQNFVLILGITLTLSLSGFCWSKILYKQSELQVSNLPTAESATRTGKKVVFLGGIFFGITKYLSSDN